MAEPHPYAGRIYHGRKANEIDSLMADRSIPMDFLVLTPEQYERQKNIIGTIGRQADQEGRVIYERSA